MFDQISIPKQIGLSVLTVASVVSAVGLVRMLRRVRSETTTPYAAGTLYALPQQRSHADETVQLSAAERDAFASLIRQLTNGRR